MLPIGCLKEPAEPLSGYRPYRPPGERLPEWLLRVPGLLGHCQQVV